MGLNQRNGWLPRGQAGSTAGCLGSGLESSARSGGNRGTPLTSAGRIIAVANRAGYGQMRWHAVWLGLVFILAAAWRFNDLSAPGHLADREYTSAIFARTFYFEANPTIDDWRRDIAQTTMIRQPALEPPVTDYLVSLLYRLAGREDLRYARFLTSMFWLVGGLFMYRLARDLLSPTEAVYATGYYLLLPMSVLISRSFQPDSLMMMTYLISLVCLWRYFRQPSAARALLAGGMSGITLLVRPLVAFALAAALIGLVVWRLRTGQGVEVRHLALFGLISLLPPVLYYGYGIAFAGFMRWKVNDSFRPFLLARRQFWTGWMNVAISVVGQGALVAALLGFPLIRRGAARDLVIGLGAGYVLFGVAFTYHIHTHPYYHIQLIPIIALGLAAALRLIIEALKRLQTKWWMMPGVLALLLTLYLSHKAIQGALYSATVENPRVAQEVGRLVNHSSRTVFIARHYGIPLQYMGEFTGSAWPVRIEDVFYRWPGERERTVEERIAALDFIPDYYVVTSFDEAYRRHQDLLDYLAANCQTLARTETYLIYHKCRTELAGRGDDQLPSHVLGPRR
jgi:hypothetical protein